MEDLTEIRYKSTKNNEIKRFEFHEYENKIQNLLEKIDILESKLILVCKDKYNIKSENEDFEKENEKLKEEIQIQNNQNRKLSNTNTEYEHKIKKLENNYIILQDKTKSRINELNNEINYHKNCINNLNNVIESKNTKIRNYSVENKLINKTSNQYKNLLNKQRELNKNGNKKILNLQNKIDDMSLKQKKESALLLEIELLRKDNIKLIKLLNSTQEYKHFCHLGQTLPGGIKFIKPVEENKSTTFRPLTKKEERERSSKEYNKHQETKKNIVYKDERNWVPLEAYNYLIESNKKYNLNLNIQIIENLLRMLNNYWVEKLDREINHYRILYQNEIKDLKCKLENYNKYKEDGSDAPKTTKNSYNIKINEMNNDIPKIDYIENDMFNKTINFRNNYLENEIAILNQKLNEKSAEKKKIQNKIYSQGNLIMTSKIIEEIKRLNNYIDKLFDEYQERVKFSVGDIGSSKNKNNIINEAVKNFFSSVKNAIKEIENKLEIDKFNIERNIGGLEHVNKI